MHSFHHSRGRILFEALCALAISASLAGAWMQTGATALLPGAAVGALYALFRAFDVRRAPIAIADRVEPSEPAMVAIPEPDPAPVANEAAAAAAKPKRKSRKKAAASIEAADLPVVEIAPETPPPAATEHEEYHAPVVPLFEAQPLVRQHRAIFGRKAG